MSLEISNIVYSHRKTLTLHIDDYGQIIVRSPKYCTMKVIENFVIMNTPWILKKQALIQEKISKFADYQFDEKHKKLYKRIAKSCLNTLLSIYAKELGLNYVSLKLSGAKKRWGSCTSRKLINLNWKLIFLPLEQVRYVIIHELVHLKHMNHSRIFWADVEKVLPEYKKTIKELTKNDYVLMI